MEFGHTDFGDTDNMGWQTGEHGSIPESDNLIFLFFKAHTPSLTTTQLPIQRQSWVPSSGVERPEREPNKLPPRRAVVKLPSWRAQKQLLPLPLHSDIWRSSANMAAILIELHVAA